MSHKNVSQNPPRELCGSLPKLFWCDPSPRRIKPLQLHPPASVNAPLCIRRVSPEDLSARRWAMPPGIVRCTTTLEM